MSPKSTSPQDRIRIPFVIALIASLVAVAAFFLPYITSTYLGIEALSLFDLAKVNFQAATVFGGLVAFDVAFYSSVGVLSLLVLFAVLGKKPVLTFYLNAMLGGLCYLLSWNFVFIIGMLRDSGLEWGIAYYLLYACVAVIALSSIWIFFVNGKKKKRAIIVFAVFALILALVAWRLSDVGILNFGDLVTSVETGEEITGTAEPEGSKAKLQTSNPAKAADDSSATNFMALNPQEMAEAFVNDPVGSLTALGDAFGLPLALIEEYAKTAGLDAPKIAKDGTLSFPVARESRERWGGAKTVEIPGVAWVDQKGKLIDPASAPIIMSALGNAWVPPSIQEESESTPIVKTDEVGNGSEWKEFLRLYEEWVDDYIELIKKYSDNPSDLSLLSDSMEAMQKAIELSEQADRIQSDLTGDDLREYLATMSRIIQKLSTLE